MKATSMTVVGIALLAGLASLTAGNARAEDGLQEAIIAVDGMTCSSCEFGVSRVLKKIDGVGEVEVSYEAAEARATYDPAKTTPEELVEAVRDLGYEAELKDDTGAAETTASADAGPSCSTDPVAVPTAATAAASTTSEQEARTLTEEEIAKVADYMVAKILETGSIAFTGEEIEEATGVVVSEAHAPDLQLEVISKLSESPAGLALLSSSRCEAYEACSLYGDLSGASGEILSMYEREKTEDGRTYEDFELPAFSAFNLAGEKVQSADLRGQPTLLAFLAVHCRHSMDSFPILKNLTNEYGADGLRVVAVLINSGSVEDANSWVPRFEPNYDVWIYNDDSLGDLIHSHLVPTYLFVDQRGQVTEKLVGFKEQEALVERVASRFADESSTESPATTGR